MAGPRLSTGRAVSPLHRPKIATVRDLELPATDIDPYPPPEALQLTADDELASIGLLEAGVDELEILFEPFVPLTFETQSIEFEPEIETAFTEMTIPPVTHDGISLERRDGAPAFGPAPLPRSYEGNHSAPVEGSPPEPYLNGQLRLRLEPPIMLLDGASPALPRLLPEYLLEAVRALVGGHNLMLADDPGMGSRTVACVALWARFQRGEAKRALILVPESDLRLWSGEVLNWAPQLDLTVVRGDRTRRRLDWENGAHVYLTDYATLQYDIERGALAEAAPRFDLIVLDSVNAVTGWATHPLGALKRLEGGARWAIAGGPPQTPEAWAAIFGVLQPDGFDPRERLSHEEWQKRYSHLILRRRAFDLAEELPTRTREEVWLDLNREHLESYEAELAEERHHLAELGRSVTMEDVEASFKRLRLALSFSLDLFDSIKVRALLNRLAEIEAAGGKTIVFVPEGRGASVRLAPALQAYKPLALGNDLNDAQRAEVLDKFRSRPEHQVLLADPHLTTDGSPLMEARYFAHFDPAWNPAVRVQAESRLHPRSSIVPVHSFEFWVAGTIDERLHAVLAEKGMLAEEVLPTSAPAEFEGRIDPQEWVRHIFEIGVPSRKVKRATVGVSQPLPGTKTLREQLGSLEPERLLAGVELLMAALGFPESEPVGEPDDGGGQLAAWRDADGVLQRVLVRVVRSDRNVSLTQARDALAALEGQDDYLGAYVVTTSDFSSACKKLADDSEGRLALVSGAELYRHLQILGWF